MNDIYQRIQIAGEQADAKEILKTLAAIKAGRLSADLKLVNYYSGIPVSYPATVLTVESDSVELAVHQIQAVVIKLEKVTVLKSSHFTRDVMATVNYANVEKSRIVVSNFTYALVRADRRTSVRVELTAPLKASFRSVDGEADGKLHDISLNGVSMMSPQDPGIPLTERGKLSLELPAGTIAVTASLLKSYPHPAGHRLVFELELERATEVSISQFIFKRQVEIIKELKEHPGLPR